MSQTILTPLPDPHTRDFLAYQAPLFATSQISTRGEDSPYIPLPSSTMTVELDSHRDIEATGNESTTSFDCEQKFDYPRNDTTNTIKQAVLYVTFDPITAVDGGAEARYHDDVVNAAYEKMELWYADQCLETIEGDEQHFEEEQNHSPSALAEIYSKGRFAGLSKEERCNQSATGFQVRYPIPFFFARKASDAFPIWKFQRQFSIKIRWRHPRFFVQQTGGNNAHGNLPTPTDGDTHYSSQKFIRFETVVCTEATKAAVGRIYDSQGQGGWLSMYKDDVHYSDNIIPAQVIAREFQFRLDINKYCYNLRFVIRDRNRITAGVPTDNDRWARSLLSSYRFLMNNQEFLEPITDHEARYHYNPKLFAKLTDGIPSYNVAFCPYPTLESHASGGMEFAHVNDPRLCVTMPDNSPEVTLDLWFEFHNYIRLVSVDNKTAGERVFK